MIEMIEIQRLRTREQIVAMQLVRVIEDLARVVGCVKVPDAMVWPRLIAVAARDARADFDCAYADWFDPDIAVDAENMRGAIEEMIDQLGDIHSLVEVNREIH